MSGRAPSRLLPPLLRASSRANPRRLTFLAGVTRVVAIVAGDSQDPVLDGGHPVGGRLDIHRERRAAAPGLAGRRGQRGARELAQVPPPPPEPRLQLVLSRPGSDCTARRSTGSASQRRRRRPPLRPSSPSAWQLSRPPPGASPPEQRPLTSDAHLGRAGVGAPPGLRLSSLTLLRPFPEDPPD